jgi:hypothetical protein
VPEGRVWPSRLGPATRQSASGREKRRRRSAAGGIGVKVVETDVTVSGSLPAVDSQLPSATDTETVSTVDAGFGVLVEFPRVTLGIGVAQVAGSEGYLVGKSEVVINEVIRLDGTYYRQRQRRGLCRGHAAPARQELPCD